MITSAIRALKNSFTYQLWYTCADFYNPDNTIETSFRIVVYNTDTAPTTTGSHAQSKMFYKDMTYDFSVDTTKFTDNGALTYSLVGTLNNDRISDNGNLLTVTSIDATHFRLSGFYAHTNLNAQSGVLVVGYVKATDIKG